MSFFEKGKKGLSSAAVKRYEQSTYADFHKKLDNEIREIETLMKENEKKNKNRFSKKKGGKVK
tara:strand:+ start:425 stop:613 length:189 start_codon:yes stop_codon:yes gene_type:complete